MEEEADENCSEIPIHVHSGYLSWRDSHFQPQNYSRPECQPDTSYTRQLRRPLISPSSPLQAPHFHTRAAPEPPPPHFFYFAVAYTYQNVPPEPPSLLPPSEA